MLGTNRRRLHYPSMTALTLFLLALDFLLAVMLLDAEWDDESRRRMERVEARRSAVRQKDIDRER